MSSTLRKNINSEVDWTAIEHVRPWFAGDVQCVLFNAWTGGHPWMDVLIWIESRRRMTITGHNNTASTVANAGLEFTWKNINSVGTLLNSRFLLLGVAKQRT